MSLTQVCRGAGGGGGGKHFHNCLILEGSAPYGGLLLAPAEGWWPTATWEGPLGPHSLII